MKNIELTPKEKTVYTYASTDGLRFMAISRVGERVWANQIQITPEEKEITLPEILKLEEKKVVRTVMNTMHVFIHNGFDPSELTQQELLKRRARVPESVDFPIIHEVNDNAF